MNFPNKFQFAPAEWLPIQDNAVLNQVAMTNLADHRGCVYEKHLCQQRPCPSH